MFILTILCGSYRKSCGSIDGGHIGYRNERFFPIICMIRSSSSGNIRRGNIRRGITTRCMHRRWSTSSTTSSSASTRSFLGCHGAVLYAVSLSSFLFFPLFFSTHLKRNLDEFHEPNRSRCCCWVCCCCVVMSTVAVVNPEATIPNMTSIHELFCACTSHVVGNWKSSFESVRYSG